jgi:hypothetical protein
VVKLLRRYPTLQDLHGIAQYTIEARDTFSEAEAKSRSDALVKLTSEQAPTDLARAKIALFVLETGGQAYVNYLLEQLEEEPIGPPGGATATQPAPPATPPSSTDALVRLLAAKYTLDELVAHARQLLTDPAALEWVTKTAQPAAGVTEEQQKSAIANRLVRENLEGVKKLPEVQA